MFEHSKFEHYSIKQIPLNRDLYLRDVKYMAEYHQAALDWAEKREKEWKIVGYASPVAARRIDDKYVELSWIADFGQRYHAVTVLLPRDQIVCCVGARMWDEDPSIWVKSEWLEQMYSRMYAVFGLIDVIGIREALANGIDLGERLPSLRTAIDDVAARYPDLSFVSFADSLVLKSDWNAMHHRPGDKYRYNPERMLEVFRDLRTVYRDVLGLRVYGVFTQGMNEYVKDTSLHISSSGNHVCLNSLGAPFADLMKIDDAARSAMKRGVHTGHELYLEQEYFLSLRLNFEYEPRQKLARYDYHRAMTKQYGQYVCTSCDELLANLRGAK